MENLFLIKTEHLVKRFPVGGGEFTALKDINLTFKKGEFSGIIGPSGSGKTTLLNIIGSLDVPTEGSAVVRGKSIEHLTHVEAAALRNQYIGFIFQMYNLLHTYTVYENIELPLLLLKMPEKKRRKAVEQALEWVHLSDKIKSRPAQLSGGESQRVAIARAMVKRPEIVIADEITANIDAENSHHILEIMQWMNKELHATFIFSTHDEKVIEYLNRRIYLVDGMVVKDEIIIHNDPVKTS